MFYVLDREEELIKVALLSMHTHMGWLRVRKRRKKKKNRKEEREKCQSYDSEFTVRERRKSNGYMDKCVSSTSYATLGGMSDHHYVFLCYLTVYTQKKTTKGK
jgi:hypothetical protein